MSPTVFVRRMVWSTATLPAVWLGVFWLFVLRARLALGHWPAPYRPDPKDLGFDLHHGLVTLLFPLVFVTPPLLACWALLGHRSQRAIGVKPWPAVIVGVAVTAAVLALAYLDPGRFLEWYAD